MLPVSFLVGLLQAAGGAVYPSPLTGNIQTALVGDSITAFGNAQQVLASGLALASDSSGNITATVTNQIYGNPEVYPNNINDATFEVYGRNTYNSASISIATARTTVASTTAQTNGAVTMWNRFTGRGIFMNLKSLFQGGLEFAGNYGHGGQKAQNMGPQMDYALSRNPNLVILMAGINDINGTGATAATVFGYVQTLIQKCVTAGVPVVVLAVMPVGTAISGYATLNGTGASSIQQLNVLLRNYVATIPTKAVFADTFTPVFDTTNGCFYTAMTVDGLHPKAIAATLMAPPVYAAMSPWVTCPVLLPTSAADTGSVNGHAKFIIQGPWVTTNGGVFATGVTASTGASGTPGTLNYIPSGGTGGLPPGWEGLRGVGSPTATCSLFDPGDGKGIKAQIIAQAAATGDSVEMAPIFNGTLTSLGLNQGDEICIAAEVDWSNGTGSGLGLVSMTVQSNSSGAYGQATTAETNESAAGGFPDSMTGRILVTGWMKINNASFTSLQAFVTAQFGSPGASPAVINMRRFTVYKR